MSGQIINLKIDVTKIDKARLFKGEKGTYLDAAAIPTPNNQYGDDYMIVQQVSKQEREDGVKGAILGNAKILVRQDAPQQVHQATTPADIAEDEQTDGWPF